MRALMLIEPTIAYQAFPGVKTQLATALCPRSDRVEMMRYFCPPTIASTEGMRGASGFEAVVLHRISVGDQLLGVDHKPLSHMAINWG
jgi:hypothetical protein